MRNFFLLFCFFSLVLVSCEGNKNTEQLDTSLIDNNKFPVMEFTDTLHDFGKLQEGEEVTYTFEFKNTGEAPLVVDNASASCGCTIPEKPKEPVAPGKMGKLVVKFNSDNKSGIVTKEVYVTANTRPSMNKIYVRAEIMPK